MDESNEATNPIDAMTDDQLVIAYFHLTVTFPDGEQQRHRMAFYKAPREEKIRQLRKVALGMSAMPKIVVPEPLPAAPAITDIQLRNAYKRIVGQLDADRRHRAMLPTVGEFGDLPRAERESWLHVASEAYIDESKDYQSPAMDTIFLAEIGTNAFPPAAVGPMLRLAQRIEQLQAFKKRLDAEVDAIELEFHALTGALRAEKKAS